MSVPLVAAHFPLAPHARSLTMRFQPMNARSSATTIQVGEQRFEARSEERFDRIAYALDLLRILDPPFTVAVYPRRRQLLVERGRDLGAGDGGWAIVGIPAHATREQIASTLVELCGLGERRFVVDLLAQAGAASAS
jgi:hypothetical protein